MFKETMLVESESKSKFEEYVDFFHLTEADLKKCLLDVGCGTGDFVKYLRNSGNKKAYGVEIDESKLDSIDHDGIMVADASELPFSENTFDLVTARHYLSMFLNKDEKSKKAITELLRVIKPNGKLVADISSEENEDENIRLVNEMKVKENIIIPNTPSWFQKRKQEVVKLMIYLESLENDGYKITIDELRNGGKLLTIIKPDSL